MAKGKAKGGKAEARAQENALVRWYREVRGELAKVTWPTREYTFRMTWVVLGLSAAVGLILGAVDLLFSWLATMVFG